MLKIALVIIFCPLIIWGIIWGIKKIISPVAGTMRWITPFVYLRGWISSKLPTKKKIIFFVVIGGLIYSYYPKITLKITQWMVERAQLAKAVEPLKKRLGDLWAKATDKSGNGLSDDEAAEMRLLKEEIAAAEKKVMEGPPTKFQTRSKVVSCKWFFGFRTEFSQIANAAKRGIDQDAAGEEELITCSIASNEIRFSYKRNGEVRKVLLTKSQGEQYYHGIVDLPNGRKLLIWLREDPLLPDSFVGTIKNWDGVREYPQVGAYLKKTCW